MPFKFNPLTGFLDYYQGSAPSPSSWKTTVADFSSLPSMGNTDGDARVTLDTHTVYIWNQGITTWVPISSGSYSVDKFTLDSTDISNKFVTLSNTPSNPSESVLNIVGGVVQDYSVDYTITTNQLSWDSLTLDGVLVSGDKIIVQYN